jgi:hypothetical protein
MRNQGKPRQMPEEGVGLWPHSPANRLWEFAALAHEFKQPLTATLSNAQAALHLLALDPPDVQEVCLSLADVIANTRRANEGLRELQGYWQYR